jgi:hypothetical protein
VQETPAVPESTLRNTTEAILDQAMEQLGRMNAALIALRCERLSLPPRSGVPELRSAALPLLYAT